MSVGKIKVFASTSFNRRRILQLLGKSAQRKGHDCEIVEGFDYSECEVAVVWGLPKQKRGESKASATRQKLRHGVFEQHRGGLVVVEAPVIGRRVQPLRERPKLISKIFPDAAPWTKMLFPQAKANTDRFAHYRIGFGGFPDDGGLALGPFCAGRWQSLSRKLGLPDVSPYRKTGQHILVIGQVPGDASLRGTDINQWVLNSCRQLRSLTDRPIIVRPHPLAADFAANGLPGKLSAIGVEIDDISRPLTASLAGAWSVVTYSSGAAVDALIAGIPAISISPASFAWEVTDHALECALDPTLFERGPWLETIAATQWCEDEIARGDVWEPLLKALAAGVPGRSAAQAAA
ncbi:hypothetical protein [Aestuariivirga sp.]|uniref:hypothetical protein n=1 Tax=Aestuariivirga sp. TaxID=2650926 RepID=UPI003BAC7A3C